MRYKELILVISFSVMIGLPLATAGEKAETLSDNEMDGMVGKFLDAKATLTLETGAKSNVKDGGQALASSTGSNTGIANLPIFNGVTVKNDTVPNSNGTAGKKTGGVAAAHTFAQAIIDRSNHASNNDAVANVTSKEDVAVAHGIGSVALIKGKPQKTQSRTGNNATANDLLAAILGGGQNTYPSGRAVSQGNGNAGSVRNANNDSTIDDTEELAYSSDVQESAKGVAVVNSLREVGNAGNAAPTMNESKGTLLFNINSGVQLAGQDAYNFSNTLSAGTTNTTVKSSSTITSINLGHTGTVGNIGQ